MRIGLLGGTFNPVHNGHLYIARQALKKLRLNRVIFIPAYMPPHKKIRSNAKPTDRLRMLGLAIGREKRFSISEYEIRRKGTSYSIRTAKFLKKKFGKGARFFFLIGADSLKGLGKWKDITALFGLLRFVVISRPDFGIKSGFTGIIKLRVAGKDVSSSKIRRLVKVARPISRFVPRAVSLYIKKHKLYRE